MIQIEKKDLKPLKEKWWKEQEGKCPVLGKEFPIEQFCIDHTHKLKAEEADETGKGCIRGAIQFQANAWEGKVLGSFKRLGLEKHANIIDALRNLADYLEHNRQHTEPELLIHPNEKPLKPMLLKSSYNKLVKAINGSTKVPPYSEKRGNFNKKLESLFKKFNLEPEFKK